MVPFLQSSAPSREVSREDENFPENGSSHYEVIPAAKKFDGDSDTSGNAATTSDEEEG